MSAVAHFFMAVSGSFIHERMAQLFVDIYTISILENDEQLTIPAATGKHLLISTCYPFYYSGSAPQKIVVLAKQNK